MIWHWLSAKYVATLEWLGLVERHRSGKHNRSATQTGSGATIARHILTGYQTGFAFWMLIFGFDRLNLGRVGRFLSAAVHAMVGV